MSSLSPTSLTRRVLFVGDVHATPEELEDCRALFRLVNHLAVEWRADEICLLGDSYHTNNVVRVEVLAFWRETFALAPVGVSALVGNHDYAGEGSKLHAMAAHHEQIEVVDQPVLRGGILYMPYYSDREAFVADANRLGGTTLVCHQTFAGSKYENGFYAEDGVDPDLLSHELVLSGHIHTPQSFGKVTYVGAPRWRTLSDANVERALWLYEFDYLGRVVSRHSFDTGETCRQIRYVVDTPDDPFTGVLDPRFDWRVDVRGPAAYVEERRKQLAGPGVRLRSFKEERRAPVVRESEGIDVAFAKFAAKFRGRRGTDPEMMVEMVRRYLG
jgi:DNA repair exonuclease SbcCD nuclease subunit